MLLVILFIITQVHGVDIGLEDICGNKLVGTCPDSINTKVVGGDNSCAEKVPWNVLIELVKGPKISAAGQFSDVKVTSVSLMSNYQSGVS